MPQPLALADLLTRAGARIRGRRADCPRCKRQRTVSFDESRGVYHCHGAGCDFSGGAARLARELGLARQVSGAEYRELGQNRERANQAALVLYERVRARRFELMEELRGLGLLEAGAHTAGENHPLTWDALALVYGRQPALLAELTILENCGAADLLRFLSADNATRGRVIASVIEHGGLWLERDLPCWHCTIIRPEPEVRGTCPGSCCRGTCRKCNGKGVVQALVLVGETS